MVAIQTTRFRVGVKENCFLVVDTKLIAIVGGIIGGGKGAMLGVIVGGGGTIAATDGSDIDLPLGTILRIRLDQVLEVPIER